MSAIEAAEREAKQAEAAAAAAKARYLSPKLTKPTIPQPAVAHGTLGSLDSKNCFSNCLESMKPPPRAAAASEAVSGALSTPVKGAAAAEVSGSAAAASHECKVKAEAEKVRQSMGSVVASAEKEHEWKSKAQKYLTSKPKPSPK